ncbi:jg21615, partial [Pararge aegeria aegeria]
MRSLALTPKPNGLVAEWRLQPVKQRKTEPLKKAAQNRGSNERTPKDLFPAVDVNQFESMMS